MNSQFWTRFGLLPFRSPLLRESLLISFPLGTEMFHFPRCAPIVRQWIIEVYSIGFPHSEIAGSKVALHLTDAYRSYATSFIAFFSLGIPRVPFSRNSYQEFQEPHSLFVFSLCVPALDEKTKLFRRNNKCLLFVDCFQRYSIFNEPSYF
jgi:hypothetical protein